MGIGGAGVSRVARTVGRPEGVMIVTESRLSALLVINEDDAFLEIDTVLRALGIETQRVHSCRQAEALLSHAERLPHLIFSSVALSDGTWAEVLQAAASSQHLPDILVSRLPDV